MKVGIGILIGSLCVLAVPAIAQKAPSAPEANAQKEVPKVFVRDLPQYNKEYVSVEGRTGEYVRGGTVSTKVYTLTDDYGGKVRVRANKELPPIGLTFKVSGTVVRDDAPPRQYYLIEDSRIRVYPKVTTVQGSTPDSTDQTTRAKPEDEGSGPPWWVYALAALGGLLLLTGIGWMIADSRRKSAERIRRMRAAPVPPMPPPQPVMPGAAPSGESTVGATAAPAPAPLAGEGWATLKVSDGPASVPPFEIRQNSVSVGRDPGAGGLKLPDPAKKNEFSRKQFTISKSVGGATLADQSSNGTIVDGEKVFGKTVSLKDGSVLKVGPYTIVFSLAEPAGATVAPTAPEPETIAPKPAAAAGQETLLPTGLQLTVREGVPADKGKTFPVIAGSMTIGRQEGQDVRLEDASASRTQAVIEKDSEGFWIVNRSDKFAPSVNGVSIGSERVKLEPGAEIKFGETTLLFDKKS